MALRPSARPEDPASAVYDLIEKTPQLARYAPILNKANASKIELIDHAGHAALKLYLEVGSRVYECIFKINKISDDFPALKAQADAIDEAAMKALRPSSEPVAKPVARHTPKTEPTPAISSMWSEARVVTPPAPVYDRRLEELSSSVAALRTDVSLLTKHSLPHAQTDVTGLVARLAHTEALLASKEVQVSTLQAEGAKSEELLRESASELEALRSSHEVAMSTLTTRHQEAVEWFNYAVAHYHGEYYKARAQYNNDCGLLRESVQAYESKLRDQDQYIQRLYSHCLELEQEIPKLREALGSLEKTKPRRSDASTGTDSTVLPDTEAEALRSQLAKVSEHRDRLTQELQANIAALEELKATHAKEKEELCSEVAKIPALLQDLQRQMTNETDQYQATIRILSEKLALLEKSQHGYAETIRALEEKMQGKTQHYLREIQKYKTQLETLTLALRSSQKATEEDQDAEFFADLEARFIAAASLDTPTDVVAAKGKRTHPPLTLEPGTSVTIPAQTRPSTLHMVTTASARIESSSHQYLETIAELEEELERSSRHMGLLEKSIATFVQEEEDRNALITDQNVALVIRQLESSMSDLETAVKKSLLPAPSKPSPRVPQGGSPEKPHPVEEIEKLVQSIRDRDATIMRMREELASTQKSTRLELAHQARDFRSRLESLTAEKDHAISAVHKDYETQLSILQALLDKREGSSVVAAKKAPETLETTTQTGVHIAPLPPVIDTRAATTQTEGSSRFSLRSPLLPTLLCISLLHRIKKAEERTREAVTPTSAHPSEFADGGE